MNFHDLWERSRSFKAVFRANGVTNMTRALFLWHDRFPKLEWRICGIGGCSKIAAESDRFCMDHIIKQRKQLPEWLFIRGRLYRYQPIRIGHAGETRARDYMEYARLVSEKMFGPLQVGYAVHYIDGNALNCQKTNLVHLSHISRAAMNNIRLPLDTAVRIDGCIHDLITGQTGRAQAAAIVTYGDIAKWTGLSLSGVRMAVKRGELTMADSDSVIEYIVKKNSERRCG